MPPRKEKNVLYNFDFNINYNDDDVCHFHHFKNEKMLY